jgi:2-iminobutanoate/2-iminopropanoate deaminase
MPKQVITTDNAAPPMSSYSQGIRAGDFIFVTGCAPFEVGTGKLRGETIDEQTEIVIDNLEGILRAAGASLADVVKSTVFLLDPTEFPQFNEVYERRFPQPYPARSTIGADLRTTKGMRVEMDCTAYTGL